MSVGCGEWSDGANGAHGAQWWSVNVGPGEWRVGWLSRIGYATLGSANYGSEPPVGVGYVIKQAYRTERICVECECRWRALYGASGGGMAG